MHTSRPPARRDLLTGPVGGTLVKLSVSAFFGIAAVMLFNVADTIFVGQLGARELAAMSFTFPITLGITYLVMGVGIGVSSVISRAVGHGDHRRVRQATTHSLLLAVCMVLVLASAGLSTLDFTFRTLGASEDLLPLIREYMTPYYAGVGLLVVPMVGNSALRGTGDITSPSVIMMISGGVNVLIDPLLIFGLGPFPRLGLQGAAIATVLSWIVTFAAALWLLAKRERMIEWRIPVLAELRQSLRDILYVGIPAAGTNLLNPVSTGILTRLVSTHGAAAVAAYGVGTRVEALTMIGIYALAIASGPFTGQNFGARKTDRVRDAVRFCVLGCLVWGGGAALMLGVLSGPVAALFSNSDAVREIAARYLFVVPVSFALIGISVVINSIFNAVNQPLKSALIIFIRLFVLALPLAFLGNHLGGITGVFLGISAANGLIGLIALAVVRRFLDHADHRREPAPATAT